MDFSESTDMVSSQTITSPIQPSSQSGLTSTGSQIGSLVLFLLLFMVSYLYLKQWHRKHAKQQTNTLHQQVEMLERIWSMKTHQKP